jgi:hypothetical protein
MRSDYRVIILIDAGIPFILKGYIYVIKKDNDNG